MTTPTEAAATADFGVPGARKTGRDLRWPYVPVTVIKHSNGHKEQRQVLGLAFATRPEAVKAAAAHITSERALLERKLSSPRYRALREQYGVTL